MATSRFTLTYDRHADTFAFTTLDSHGYEHVELFTVPQGAPVFVVAGMDCALMRELLNA